MQTEIYIDGQPIEAPNSWNDLNDKNCLLFYSAIFSSTQSEFSQTSFTNMKLIEMATTLCGVTLDNLRNHEYLLVEEHGPGIGQQIFLAELREIVHKMLAGLFDITHDDEGNVTYAVKLNRTVNVYDRIQYDNDVKYNRKKRTPNIQKKYLYPPADELANVTIYELGMLFALFEQYVATNDEKIADKIIAVMYRPQKPITNENKDSGFYGDRRLPLRGHESRIEERQQLCAKLPLLAKRIILFWFASCRAQITDQYPKVFKKSGGDGSSTSHYGWGGVLLKVAEQGAMGTLNEVADQPHGNVLTYLSMKADEYQESLRQTKK